MFIVVVGLFVCTFISIFYNFAIYFSIFKKKLLYLLVLLFLTINTVLVLGTNYEESRKSRYYAILIPRYNPY